MLYNSTLTPYTSEPWHMRLTPIKRWNCSLYKLEPKLLSNMCSGYCSLEKCDWQNWTGWFEFFYLALEELTEIWENTFCWTDLIDNARLQENILLVNIIFPPSPLAFVFYMKDDAAL